LDNLTHALVGAALAELALPRAPSKAERRLFLAAGVIASNCPDLDLVYTGVTPAPLGYLLHHRGHTHTVAGLVAQALLIALVCLAPPLLRAIRAAGVPRFSALVAMSLAGHLVLDSWNTYGVHPFAPLDSRWYYGDAICIFEPWLWLLLGSAAALNAHRRRAGLAIAVVVLGLLVALSVVGVLPMAAFLALIACGGGLAWVAHAVSSRARAAAALTAMALFVAGMFGLAAVARSRTRAAVGTEREVLDVVVNPNPGWPVCWDVIAVARDGPDLVLRRGTLSLLPARYPPDRCPSHRLERRGPAPASAPLVWQAALRQPVDALHDLARKDCWVRGWLQFGRAPFVRDGTIADLRFESARGNFTAMALTGEERACPPAMTSWSMPRGDVVGVP
jgi:inner membrane protein